VREFDRDAMPPAFDPPCAHGYEVASLRRQRDGTFVCICLPCRARGALVPVEVLEALGWRIPEIEAEATLPPADTEAARLARARAKAALHGYTVTSSGTTFVAERWGLMKEFDDLAALERWLAFVLGARP
jgi:hypothetical protein